MKRARLTWFGTALFALVLAFMTPVTSGAASGSARVPSLTVTPNGGFVAGQMLTLRGQLGRTGRRAITIEHHMGRPGDIWRPVPQSHGRTRANGRFVLRTRAPSMRGISFRVRSRGLATPSVLLSALTQDVVLRVESDGATMVEGEVLAGRPFSVVATTTPVLVGRTVTLQQRTGSQAWATLGATTTDATGAARFAVPAQQTGQVVYRVRAEDWLVKGDRVGWAPSFPIYVNVVSQPSPRTVGAVPARAGVTARSAMAPQVTADVTYGWGRHLFDFGWEYGESLTSPPMKGTKRRGEWLDVSNGTGRVTIFNGAMQMQSGVGTSRGSLWALMRKNVQARGRWESRIMPWRGASPVTFELVPTGAGTSTCVAPSITVARLLPAQGVVEVGARGRDGASWSRTLPIATAEQFHAFAVEVKRSSIHWLIDGKVVGRLKHASAVTGKKFTVRITVEGGENDVPETGQTLVDWVRGAPLGYGRTARGGARLTPGSFAGC